MDTRNTTPANDVSNISNARERMKRAARGLENAVAEQLRVVTQFQANLTALDKSLDGVETSISAAHDSLGTAVSVMSCK